MKAFDHDIVKGVYTNFDKKVMTALWKNFICDLPVLQFGTIIRPIKRNDMNRD